MEQLIAAQTKTNESLSASINLLTSKLFDATATHQKAIDTQIAQIAQQVSHLSRPQGNLPGQPEINPKDHINAIFTMRDGLEESPVMVLQETSSVPDFVGTKGEQKERRLSFIETVNLAPPTHPYQPPVPYPQRLA